MNKTQLKQLNCSQDEKDRIRDIKLAIRQGNRAGSSTYSNEGGHGGTRLPPLSRGQEYLEFQLGAANDGSRGRHRLVALIGSDGRSYEALYFTDDHYATFVEITP